MLCSVSNIAKNLKIARSFCLFHSMGRIAIIVVMENQTPDGEVVGGTPYWFRAKTYGWGWVPATWQGWSVLAVYLLLVTYSVLSLNFDPATPAPIALRVIAARIFAPTLILLFICWKKGEPPHWSWGKK
jgi:hypothetical protein